MRTIEFISDEEGQEGYDPHRLPLNVKSQFVKLFGRDPDPEHTLDGTLLTLLDCEGDVVDPESLSELLGVGRGRVDQCIREARSMLRVFDSPLRIASEHGHGWYLTEAAPATSTAEEQTPEIAPTPEVAPKPRRASTIREVPMCELAQAIFDTLQRKDIHLNRSQKLIIQAYALAGLRMPLSYEDVTATTGLLLSSVQSTISGLRIHPYVITGPHGQPKYLDYYPHLD